MDLSNLKPAEGSVKNNSKRLGRGQGSGKGGTAARGHKGAKSRSGYSRKIGFEGGQQPLQRRLPKFGFKSPNRVEYKGINISTLQRCGTVVGNRVRMRRAPPIGINSYINQDYLNHLLDAADRKPLTADDILKVYKEMELFKKLSGNA